MIKKFLFTFLLVVCCFSHVRAQGISIHLKDGSTVIYSTDDIEKITVFSSEDGLIIGTWHLGFWKRGTAVLHFDGTEYMSFSGADMIWAGRQDGSDTYTIEYSDDNQTFRATNTVTNQVTEWTIVKYTKKLLVLRNGGVDRYFYTSEAEARNAIMEQDPPNHTESCNVEDILKYASGYTHSTQTPMGKHYENKHVTTADDKIWLLNPDNEPNNVAGLTQWIAKPVNLYPYGTPVPADVNQHSIGDCSAMAVFASLAYMCPDFIKHIIKDNGNNTYTINMYDPQGESIEVCVSNKILCNSSGVIGQVTGKNNVITWATILEKAFMKWEKLYAVDGVEGIGTEFLAPLFTGCGDSFSFSPNSLYTSELKTIIEWALNQGMISVGGFTVAGLQCGALQTVTAHAFTYMLSNNASSIFAMRNPWGIESVDGVLEIPDDRTIVQTIDARLVYPGAAADYLRTDLGPYTPPAFTRRASDIGVAPRLLTRVVNENNKTELW